MLADQSDVLSLLQGSEQLRNVMATGPIADLMDAEHERSEKFVTREDLEEYVRQETTIACHSVGMCRMRAHADTFVNPQLEVQGKGDLWVANASVMPYNINDNTNADSLMIGYK